MIKVIGQTFLSVVLLSFFATSAVSSNIPTLSSPTSYKFFKPILQAMGYRPLSVHVFDQGSGAPISNAAVLVTANSDQGEDPANHELLWTDKDGNVSFGNFALEKDSQNITVKHPDYSGFTVFDMTATELRVPLVKLVDDTQKTVISGEFTNWPAMEDFDDVVHIGFLMPFIDIIDFVDFNQSKLLAPKVKAYIYKETEVPGNLVIPTQEERYLGLISVYMSKPRFQMPLATGTIKNMLALSGQIPFSDLVRGVLNKQPLTRLLNLISMDQFGLALNYQVTEHPAQLSIDMANGLSSKFSVEAKNMPSNKDIIFVSLSSLKENENEVFPLDFKVASRKANQKKALLKSIYSRQHMPPLQDVIVAIAADLPKNSGDKRKLDSALTGAIQRPSRLQFDFTFDEHLNLFDLAFNEQKQEFSFRMRANSPHTVPADFSVAVVNVIDPATDKTEEHSQTWWTVLMPASRTYFTIPSLPDGLSDLPNVSPTQELKWVLNRFTLNEELVNFSFDTLDHETFGQNLTHFARNQFTIIKPRD